MDELGHRLSLILRCALILEGNARCASGELSTEVWRPRCDPLKLVGRRYESTGLRACRAGGNPRHARRWLCRWREYRGRRAESSAYAAARNSTASGPRWRNSVLPVCADRGKPAPWPVRLRAFIVLARTAEAPTAHRDPDRSADALDASARSSSAGSSRSPSRLVLLILAPDQTNRNPTTSKDRTPPQITTDSHSPIRSRSHSNYSEAIGADAHAAPERVEAARGERRTEDERVPNERAVKPEPERAPLKPPLKDVTTEECCR